MLYMLHSNTVEARYKFTDARPTFSPLFIYKKRRFYDSLN